MNLAVGKGYFCDQSWEQPMPSITETRDRHLTARAGPSDGMVAVGTLIAERPPHRSRRALLTHRAPPSGRTFGEEHCRRALRSTPLDVSDVLA